LLNKGFYGFFVESHETIIPDRRKETHYTVPPFSALRTGGLTKGRIKEGFKK
jgi:hypothetical protein